MMSFALNFKIIKQPEVRTSEDIPLDYISISILNSWKPKYRIREYFK